MSSLSTSLKSLGISLITEFGQVVTVTRNTVVSYDPVTSNTTTSTSTYSAYGVPEEYSNNQVDGVNVLVGDIRLLVGGITAEPNIGDVVSLSSIDYRVISVGREVLNGEAVLYYLQLRV